ncbi:tyrosine-type recombinase/integrase [Clostridium chromiireducens]|uniref:tyrosine-type recombinase/integrase n=1 Tax=Clostridium chromiireducens TaxID=225345 RepID=UPI001FA86A88|nr:tyrosine-type recombinase/integrase [Clostridium chromiireducens]
MIQFTKKRHTNATQLLGEGTDYKVIQSRLGHSDISTTLNIYFHATMEMQKSASKKISSLLSQNKKNIQWKNNGSFSFHHFQSSYFTDARYAIIRVL